MEKLNELKAWANKWGIPYREEENENFVEIYFVGQSYTDAMFSVNKETGSCAWYGGD